MLPTYHIKAIVQRKTFIIFILVASYKALDSTGASTSTFLSEAAASTQVSQSIFIEIHII